MHRAGIPVGQHRRKQVGVSIRQATKQAVTIRKFSGPSNNPFRYSDPICGYYTGGWRVVPTHEPILPRYSFGPARRRVRRSGDGYIATGTSLSDDEYVAWAEFAEWRGRGSSACAESCGRLVVAGECGLTPTPRREGVKTTACISRIEAGRSAILWFSALKLVYLEALATRFCSLSFRRPTVPGSDLRTPGREGQRADPVEAPDGREDTPIFVSALWYPGHASSSDQTCNVFTLHPQ